MELRTERLLLRAWRDADRAPFAALNADPEVMAHFPAPLTRAQSDALVQRIRAHFGEHGYGLWAVERVGLRDVGRAGPSAVGRAGLRDVGRAGPSAVGRAGPWAVDSAGLLGFCGLAWTGVLGGRDLEVGWRLARPAWGHGYAIEAATAALEVGLRHAPQVVSFTAVGNERSRRVMERLAMRRVREFDHPGPGLPERLRRHVLYATP